MLGVLHRCKNELTHKLGIFEFGFRNHILLCLCVVNGFDSGFRGHTLFFLKSPRVGAELLYSVTLVVLLTLTTYFLAFFNKFSAPILSSMMTNYDVNSPRSRRRLDSAGVELHVIGQNLSS